MECRKEQEQLVMVTGLTKRPDGVGTEVKGASEVEKWMDVLNISVGTDFILSSSFFQVADVTGSQGLLRGLGFLLKTRTVNVSRRWKIRLLHGCVIGFGM